VLGKEHGKVPNESIFEVRVMIEIAFTGSELMSI
jgi:hypothetical protein